MKKTDAINQEDLVFNNMLGLLSKQSYTKKEIENKLRKKQIDEDIIERVVEKLCEYKYLDDERFARNFVALRIDQKSRREIEFKLIAKGVDRKIVYVVLEELKKTDTAVQKTAEKYLRGKPKDEKTFQKLYAYLFGKGFESEEIARVIRIQKQSIKED